MLQQRPYFASYVVVVGWRRGKMTPGPRVRWNGVRWGWCGPTCDQGGGGQQREWGLRREGVKVDLQWEQVAERRKPCQELGDLEGCRPHIPRGQIRGMSGTAEEVGHHVVDGAAIGTGGVPEWRTVGWPLPLPRPPKFREQLPAEWSHRRRTSCLGLGLGSLTQSGWRGLGR